MSNDLWVQLIGYVISGSVALFVASVQHSKTTTLLEYRLQQLEKKVDAHNNFMERLGAIEVKLNMMQERDSETH